MLQDHPNCQIAQLLLTQLFMLLLILLMQFQLPFQLKDQLPLFLLLLQSFHQTFLLIIMWFIFNVKYQQLLNLAFLSCSQALLAEAFQILPILLFLLQDLHLLYVRRWLLLLQLLQFVLLALVLLLSFMFLLLWRLTPLELKTLAQLMDQMEDQLIQELKMHRLVKLDLDHHLKSWLFQQQPLLFFLSQFLLSA